MELFREPFGELLPELFGELLLEWFGRRFGERFRELFRNKLQTTNYKLQTTNYKRLARPYGACDASHPTGVSQRVPTVTTLQLRN